MLPLPIDDVLPEILAALERAAGVVVVAPPGAGKTTRVPAAIVRSNMLGEAGQLIMLQPRRVAARAAATRIAQEQGWTLGREVGYQVRFEKQITAQTRLRIETEGILTRQLLDDPFLEGIGCVVLDEFHERSIHTDLAIALLREVQQTVRPDLKLVVMSATLDAGPVAAFLGGTRVIESAGKMHPVEIAYDPPPDSLLPLRQRVIAHAARVVAQQAQRPGAGDVLVFLPGAEEIRRVGMSLAGWAREHAAVVLPLYGSLPFEEQNRALAPDPQGWQRVILATNIAETSLTIDGVRTVIDSGLVRVASYDRRRGMDKLELEHISAASSAQRAGRAGRTAPGRCVRLWAQRRQRLLAPYQTPEIARVDLASAALTVHAWGRSDLGKFGWYEPPAAEALTAAERLLAMLGATSGAAAGQITPLGKRLLDLPVHPRVARLLAAADPRQMREAAGLAALIEEKDILRTRGRGPATVARSDLLVRLRLLEDIERSRFAEFWQDRGVDLGAARQVARSRDQLQRVAPRAGTGLAGGVVAASNEDSLLKLILLAYPDRVVRRRANDSRSGLMVGGGGVQLAEESAVTQEAFYVAVDVREDGRDERGARPTRGYTAGPTSGGATALVHIASAINPEWLEELFPNAIQRVTSAELDERERVVPMTRVLYRDLAISERASGNVDPEQAAALLAAAIRPEAADLFARDEAASEWLARVELVRHAAPDAVRGASWPEITVDALADLLAAAAHGKMSLDALRQENRVRLLDSLLDYAQRRALDELAPETLTVPTGNHIHIRYQRGQAPVLAVRLQELFGWTDTPRIAGKRVPVVLHLLGPNYRPVQVTNDLRSFWSNAYFLVRKDLKARYPKHAWPEDPLTAPAEARGRRRGK